MARRSNNIEVQIVGEADFKSARREASRAFDRIESDGRDAAQDIDRAFERIDFSPDGLDEIGPRLSAAGEEGAEGIADALGGIDFRNIGATGVDQLTGALAAAGPWVAAAGAVAAIFGDELAEGFNQAMNRRKNDIMRAIRTGASDADLAVAGQAAGEAWTAGFGESLQDVTATADELVRTLGDIVPEADLAEATKQAQVLSDVLGVDVAEAATLAGRLVKQDLADNWQDAFDDMTGVVQEFGQTGLEALDIVEEFGGNFARFGVDGSQALNLVASAFRDGLVPTMDRAGEAFEEFQTRITDADSREAIEELGLSFDALQDAVAKGGPAANAAMQEVIGALLNLEDQSELTAKANIIFGQSFEQVEDPAALLELQLAALRGELDDWAGASEDAADSMEQSVTQMERLERRVVSLGGVLGNVAAGELNDLFDGFDLLGDAIELTGRRFGFFSDEAEAASDGSDEMAESIRFAAIEANALADETSNLTGELGDAADSVSDLRREFERLMGFEADELMRNLEAAIDDAADAIKETDSALVGMNGQVDITTEAGRRFESEMQDLSVSLADLYLNAKQAGVGADELASAQSRAEGQLRAAGRAAGWEESKIQALIDRFLELIGIGDVETKVTIDVDGSFQLNETMRMLRLMPKSVHVPVTVSAPRAVTGRRTTSRSTTTRRTSGGSSLFRARGGPATGLTVVGEEGPELLDLGSTRGHVTDARNTSDILNRAAAMMGGGGRSVGGCAAQPVVIRIESGGSRLDDVLVELMRKAIANRGGTVQAVLG